jgi:hypothetical protein
LKAATLIVPQICCLIRSQIFISKSQSAQLYIPLQQTVESLDSTWRAALSGFLEV